MIKVLHIVSLISVFWISVVRCEECLFDDQTWGDQNPVKIIYCNPKTKEPAITYCRTGTGYVSNDTASGCIEWKDWKDGCVLRESVPEIKSCNGSNAASPQPVQGDPTAYYLCSSSSAKPVVLPCPAGRGFVSRGGYIGCLPWGPWRNITGCTS